MSGDRRQEPPFGVPSGGTDKATDVEPLVALLHGSNRSLPDRCPDPANEGKQPDPMLVRRPELDVGSWVGGADLLYLVGELS